MIKDHRGIQIGWSVGGDFSISIPDDTDILENLNTDGDFIEALYSKVAITLQDIHGTFGNDALNIRLNVDNFLRIKQAD